MSNNQTDKAQEAELAAAEAEPEEKEAPVHQSNRERRQDRNQNQQANREARLSEDPNLAPANLFSRTSKAEVVSEDPAGLALFKEQVTHYATTAIRGAGESTEVQQATKTFQAAVRKMLTFQGETLAEAFKFLYLAIEADTKGAFSLPYPFRWAHSITGETARIAYTNFMTLVLQYVKLDDPTAIHERVDVSRALVFIKDKQQLNRVVKLFASK